uniref:PH domain-containing protein n=1 Tax=Acrobeloides nanus TaxID=290746 RepID=A0A914BV07_9BILA
MQATISFQLKDFCDQQVTDLTSVLRPGFYLSFHATSNEVNEWIASLVAPLNDAELSLENIQHKELDLDAIEFKLSGNHPASKDAYSVDMELQAIAFLLSVFAKGGTHHIPLASLHSRISNSGSEELYRYIGSSSLKRRQFIERRSYVFEITDNDIVFLQQVEVYVTVCLLSGFLLRRGGVTSSDALFAFFNSCSTIPVVLKEAIQNNRSKFMEFLSQHPFVFAPFPNKFYVAVRRNLPYFDYAGFIKKHFPTFNLRNPGNNFAYQTPINTQMNSYNSGFDAVTPLSPFTPNGLAPSFPAMNSLPDEQHILPRNPMGGQMPTNGAWPGFNGSIGMPIVGAGGPFLERQMSEGIPRQDSFNRSPPLLAFGRGTLVHASTQTEFTTAERAIGPDERCTCKCSCMNKQIEEDAARMNETRNSNSIFGAPPNRPDSLGGFTPFGFSGLPSLLSFTSQKSMTLPTTRNSSEGDASSTAATSSAPSTTNSNSSPSAEVERLFDPFAQHLSFELKIPSLKL